MEENIDKALLLFDRPLSKNDRGMVSVIEEFKNKHTVIVASFGIENIFEDGDTVILEIICTGTHKGTFMGIEATNKNVTYKSVVFYKFVDGKISVGEDSQSLKDRINISYNGFLDITILINSAGTIVKNPIISLKRTGSSPLNPKAVRPAFPSTHCV